MAFLKRLWMSCIAGRAIRHPAWPAFEEMRETQNVLELCFVFHKLMMSFIVFTSFFVVFSYPHLKTHDFFIWMSLITVECGGLLFMGWHTRKGIKQLWKQYLNENPITVEHCVLQSTIPVASRVKTARRL